MTANINVAVGLDLHKKFIIATVLWQTGEMIQERFERTREGLFSLKTWIIGYPADVIACESTSDYWVQVYDLLNKVLPVIVGNVHDIKVLSHKKTDTRGLPECGIATRIKKRRLSGRFRFPGPSWFR
jgi:transposase